MVDVPDGSLVGAVEYDVEDRPCRAKFGTERPSLTARGRMAEIMISTLQYLIHRAKRPGLVASLLGRRLGGRLLDHWAGRRTTASSSGSSATRSRSGRVTNIGAGNARLVWSTLAACRHWFFICTCIGSCLFLHVLKAVSPPTVSGGGPHEGERNDRNQI
jgi:hypothetical protein